MAKTNGNLFIACSGFPDCKHTMNLPKGLSFLKMTETLCEKCLNRDRKEVKKFKLEFETNLVNEAMSEVLADDDNTGGVFCVVPNCDEGYKTL